MLEQKPNSEPNDETLDSSSPNSANTLVVGSQSPLMPFDKVEKKVKELQDEFNKELVSLLNSCDEPVICPVITTSCTSIMFYDKPINKDTPVFLNILQRNSLGMCAEYVYGSNLVM